MPVSSRRAWCLPAVLIAALASGCQGLVATTADGDELETGASEDAGFSTVGKDAGSPGSSPPADAGLMESDSGTDAGFLGVDAGGDGGPFAVPAEPSSVFFVGNSFTLQGPIPDIFHDLAVAGGHREPRVGSRAIGGYQLSNHRSDGAGNGAPNQIRQGWDVVVLQELSIKPTDSAGDPGQFKIDATWFYDLALEANPDCRVVLYMTWARRAGHAVYRNQFSDPADMQAQLRMHYNDAAERFIPMNSAAAIVDAATVAPVGDAWELQLSGGEPPRLHDSDDYHAGNPGRYLNALVIYGTIYGRSPVGLPPIGVNAATADELQASAEAALRAAGRIP